MFTSCCWSISKQYKLKARAIFGPINLFLYLVTLGFTVDILTLCLILLSLLLKNSIFAVLNYRLAPRLEASFKHRYMRVYQLQSLLCQFKEVAYTNITDLFVRKLIESKILEDQDSAIRSVGLQSMQGCHETNGMSMFLLIYFLNRIFRTVCGYRHFFEQSSYEVGSMIFLVIMMNQVCADLFKLMRCRNLFSSSKQLIDIFLSLPVVDRRLVKQINTATDKLSRGEVLIEHLEVVESTSRYFCCNGV